MISQLLENHDARILLPSFRRYRRYIALTLGFSLIAAVFEGLSIGMLIPFLQSFSESAEPFRTGVEWADTYLLGADASRVGRMYRVCGIILVATWIRAVAGYFSSVYMVTSRARIIQDIRERITDQLTEVSLAYYATARGGEIMNSVTNEAGRTSAALTVSFTYVMKGMMLVMYAALMIWISWQLSLIALAVFIMLSVGLTRLMTSIKSRGEEITRASAAFYTAIKEFLEGVRTVIAYNMQDTERDNLHRAAQRSADSVIESTKRSKLIQPISQAVVSSVLVVLVLVAVQYFVMPGILSMAFLLTFLFALFRVMPIVHQLNNERGTWAENRAGLANVAALLQNDDKPYLPEGTRTARSLQSNIQFEDVWFAYEPGKPVLRDINLTIEQGKITAFVGASGAGKSTLVDLIPRFHDPTEGRILYDGVDLREYRKKSLRDQIAIVSQSTHIFNDSVSANIAYGTEGVTESEVHRAAEMANAAAFIDELGDGFDTVLGERGVRLSGGQRQRIAIARALLQDPDILILDEATSSLDSISERLVQESLERLMEGRTVIAIAHRLSTIENADWVVVLENGKIVEQGCYQDLLSRRGQLWEYHSVQFQLA